MGSVNEKRNGMCYDGLDCKAVRIFWTEIVGVVLIFELVIWSLRFSGRE